jgi:hypothetical protein
MLLLTTLVAIGEPASERSAALGVAGVEGQAQAGEGSATLGEAGLPLLNGWAATVLKL